jgi:HlyD family secretion protein
VVVSAKIPGRIQTLTVDEGQDVKAGQLIAVIESNDLQAARKAAEATAASQKFKLGETVETERQMRGETGSATVNAEAHGKAAQASLAQAQANYEHQQADTSRTVALAQQGIMSEQAKDDAATSLQAAKAAVDAAEKTSAAAEASLRQARAHELLTTVAARTVDETRDEAENARALAEQAKVQLGYSQVFAPVSGKVNVRAARQGEVVAAGAPIVTIMDLTQTWVYAPLPETQADAFNSATRCASSCLQRRNDQGKVINKSAEADFATQRDVSSRKRDIKTIQLKLLIDNPGERYVPGMTAEVYIPKKQAGEAVTPSDPATSSTALDQNGKSAHGAPPLRSNTSSSATAILKPSRTSASRWPTAKSSACSVPTAPAKARSSA